MAEKPNAGTAPDEAAASRAGMDAKVELDLDDAPFLEEDEPEQPPEPEETPAARPEEAAPPAAPPLSLKERLATNRKKLLMAGGVAVLLLAVGIGVNVFFSSPPSPPEPEPEKILAAPKPLPEAPVPPHLLQWEPFWIALKDTEGAARFLTLTFSVPTDNPAVFAEMTIKKLVLRDALFYYLQNQPILTLTDEAKVQAFKGDLLTVMNEHLGSGKVSEILIQDYLIQ